MDSGCTSHMTGNRLFFTSISEATREVRLADGKLLYTRGIGEGYLNCIVNGNQVKRVILENVLYIPEFKRGLLSLSKLEQKGYDIYFSKGRCTVLEGGEVVAEAKLEKNLYKLCCPQKVYSLNEKDCEGCIHCWHRRLAHWDPAIIYYVAEKYFPTLLTDCANVQSCCLCQVSGVNAMQPHCKSWTRKKLLLIHVGLSGPMRVPTVKEKRYILSIIEDYSNYCIIYLLRDKSEAACKIENYILLLKQQLGLKPKAISMYKHSKIMNQKLKKFLKKEQISIHLSDDSNGIAEMKIHFLLEMAKVMLKDANLNYHYWGDAVVAANYLQNRLPREVGEPTPYSLWFGTDPDLSHVRIFGSEAYSTMSVNGKETETPDNYFKYVFVGYSEILKSYRLLDPDTGNTVLSRDVTCVENPHSDSVYQRRNDGYDF